MTCGNVLGGQRNGNAIAGGLGSHGQGVHLLARSAELEFRGSAACRVCSPLEGTPGANSGSGSRTQWARWTAPSCRSLARWTSGGRATSCGNGASHGQNAAEDVLGVRKLLT